MTTIEKTVTCPICQQDGHAVYREMSTPKGRTVTRLQSLECPGGCWGPERAGNIIVMLNEAPVVDH